MIRFDNVTKTYQRGHSPAVEDLTIEFSRGEFVFLVGASGSGKSTLMRLVLKETSPTRGNVYVAGKDIARIPSWRVPTLRRDIGMVFQDFRLLPSKTAYQNIEFALAVIGTPRKVVRRLVPEMLEMVGLADKGRRLPHELSGGEQQRVAIARAYVNRPSILLADEPTGNLDPTTAEGILDLLAQINERGTTVVMATHDRSAVDRMRKRVVEMVGGHVIRDEEAGSYESEAPESEVAPVADAGSRSDAAPAADAADARSAADGRDASAPVVVSTATSGILVPEAETGTLDAIIAPPVRGRRRGRRAAEFPSAEDSAAAAAKVQAGLAARGRGEESGGSSAQDPDALTADAAPLPDQPGADRSDAQAASLVEQAATLDEQAVPADAQRASDEIDPAAAAIRPEGVVVDDVVDEDLYDARDAQEDEDAAAFQELEDDPEVRR